MVVVFQSRITCVSHIERKYSNSKRHVHPPNLFYVWRRQSEDIKTSVLVGLCGGRCMLEALHQMTPCHSCHWRLRSRNIVPKHHRLQQQQYNHSNTINWIPRERVEPTVRSTQAEYTWVFSSRNYEPLTLSYLLLHLLFPIRRNYGVKKEGSAQGTISRSSM